MASEKIRVGTVTREQYQHIVTWGIEPSHYVDKPDWYSWKKDAFYFDTSSFKQCIKGNPDVYFMNEGIYIKTSSFKNLTIIHDQKEFEKHKTSEPCILNSWNLIDYAIHKFYNGRLVEAIELEGAEVMPSELELECYPNCEQIVLPALKRLDSSFNFCVSHFTTKFCVKDALTHTYMPKIEKLESTFCMLEALTHIYMPKLEKLESTHNMEYLFNLKHLYLHSAKELPSNFRLYNLEGLYIGGLTELPFDISLFRNLRSLDISGLLFVPWEHIAKLSKLEYLVADGKVLEGDAVKSYIYIKTHKESE